jgi:hypothetical protein
LIIEPWKNLTLSCYSLQQPSKVIGLPITPTFNHRHGPKPQEIRLGRYRSTSEGLCRVDPFDASVTDLNEVETDTEALGSIERNLAIGLETEAMGAGRDTLPDVDECFGRGRNIHVLGTLH